jgi:hypothetical protein
MLSVLHEFGKYVCASPVPNWPLGLTVYTEVGEVRELLQILNAASSELALLVKRGCEGQVLQVWQ